MSKLLLFFFFAAVAVAVATLSACSSDSENEVLNEWFNSQGVETSYGEYFEEIDIPLKNVARTFDSSAYLITTYGVFGNANGIEQTLYFGVSTLESLDSAWRFFTDSIFYSDVFSGKFPLSKKITAKFFWVKENEIVPDSIWLKFATPFTDSAEVEFDWNAKNARDTFYIPLPKELADLKANGDTLNLTLAVKLLSDGEVLRVAAPSLYDIRGLIRVAQKAKIQGDCPKCLYSGIKDTLKISFSAPPSYSSKSSAKTVVFAQLVMPKNSGTAGSELNLPVPVYVSSNYKIDSIFSVENYRVDTAFVKKYGHPNTIFLEGADSLKLQVTAALRHYADRQNSDSLSFALSLGTPMLDPKSLYFYNSIYSTSKVFADRPSYSRYDFEESLDNVKLRLWFAD